MPSSTLTPMPRSNRSLSTISPSRRFSPADLFTRLLDRASYRGEVQVPLTGLLMPDDRSPLPALIISSPAGDFPPVITETAPGIHAEVVLHGTQPQDTVIDGITVDTQERLLLTTPGPLSALT